MGKARYIIPMGICIAGAQIAGAAVLAWAVEACLAGQHEGLGEVPTQVAAATQDYRAEMDPLADFLEDRTVAVADAWTAFADLYDSYTQWAQINRVTKPLGSTTFSKKLAARFNRENRTQRGQASDSPGSNGRPTYSAAAAPSSQNRHTGARGSTVGVPRRGESFVPPAERFALRLDIAFSLCRVVLQHEVGTLSASGGKLPTAPVNSTLTGH